MSNIEAGEGRRCVDVVDDGLLTELVARARAGGMKLTGEGGLLAELTRKVLDQALEGRTPILRHLLRRPAHRWTPLEKH